MKTSLFRTLRAPLGSLTSAHISSAVVALILSATVVTFAAKGKDDDAAGKGTRPSSHLQ